MDEDLAAKAVAFFLKHSGESDVLSISFWGGEPLLRFDLIRKIVRMAEREAAKINKQVRFSLPTNTTLLTHDMLDFFKRHNLRLSLSVDGNASSQALRKTRDGKNSFTRVRDTLKLIKNAFKGDLPYIRKTVSVKTVADLYDDICYFLDQGFTYFAISPVMEEIWKPADMQIYRQQHLKLADLWMERLRSDAPLIIRSLDEMFTIRQGIRQGLQKQDRQFFCGAGNQMIAVDIYGDIYPCHRFVFFDKDLRQERLGSILSGVTVNENRMKYCRVDSEMLLSRTKNCRTCSCRDECFLFCPAVNMSLTGSVHTNDERLCRFQTVAGQMLDYIESNAGKEYCFKKYLDMLEFRINRDNFFHGSKSYFGRKVVSDDIDRLAHRASRILEDLKRD